MLELLVGAVLLCGLFCLLLLPLMLIGAVIKLLVGLLLLPLRLLGFVAGSLGAVLGLLFKGFFGILAAVAGLVVVVFLVAMVPVGLLLLMGIAAVVAIKLLVGASLGATA